MTDSKKLVTLIYRLETTLADIKALHDVKHCNQELRTISKAIDSIKQRNAGVFFEVLYNENLLKALDKEHGADRKWKR